MKFFNRSLDDDAAARNKNIRSPPSQNRTTSPANATAVPLISQPTTKHISSNSKNNGKIVIVKDDEDAGRHSRAAASPVAARRRNEPADRYNDANLSQFIETLIPADSNRTTTRIVSNPKGVLSSKQTTTTTLPAPGNLFVNPNAVPLLRPPAAATSPPPTSPEKISPLNFARSIIGIILHVMDFGTDILVAMQYYASGDMWFLGWTLLFIIVPSTVMSIMSSIWYHQDYFHTEEAACGCCIQEWVKKYNRVSFGQRLIRIIFPLLHLAPVLRHLEAITYTYRALRTNNRCLKENLHVRAFYADRDASTLRLFEAFLEGVPQMILQLYIVSTVGEIELSEWADFADARIISILISWLSVSFTVVSFHRDLAPVDQSWTKQVRWHDVLIQFLWQLLFIGARVFVIVAVCTNFPVHGIGLVVLHCCLMICMVRSGPTRFFGNATNGCTKFIYATCIGFIFTFCFFNVFSKRSLRYFLVYYAIAVPENVAGMAFYYWYQQVFGKLVLGGVVVGATMLSVLIQLMYYWLWHPKRGQCRRKSRQPQPIVRDRDREAYMRRSSLFVEWPMHLSGYNSHCFCCPFRARGLAPQSPRETFKYKRGAPF